jgi:hypothetical protein
LSVSIVVIAVLAPEIPVSTHAEIRPASVVYPYTLVVSAPTVSFGASGAAVLRQQTHSPPRIHGAGVPPLVVRVAGNRGLREQVLRQK